MELLEYQVKEWFRTIGIPVLPSQKIDHPTDLKRLKIKYPIVLKSQVHAGERAKAGGVRFAETTIDAIAAAQNIFNLPILGELPEVLLAEAKYNAKQEFFLAVVLDTAVCRPILLGCKEADIDWESAGKKMQHVVVEQDFSPFYARRLALKMGLQGALMQSVSIIVEKMYELFIEKDLDLVEINPLGVDASGQVMALNGSVNVNERAIARHPDIAEMARKMTHRHSSVEFNKRLSEWDAVELHGKIGILGNGTGSVLATLDLVVNAGGKPGVCLNLRHAFPTDTSPTTFRDRLDRAINILAADKSIQVILVNFLGSVPQSGEVAEVIADFVQHHKNEIKTQTLRSNGNKSRRETHLPHLVVRLAGSEFNAARKYLTTLKVPSDASIVVVENLDEAVAQAVNLAKATAHKRF
ncbi:MAG: succinate--CoA ligase subunit beta [Pelatocladus maniniholoensis HA4357-MV3]|jgi:succinyl-CoA synthetase beta subunit|uniref:Succinate--CoA ligase subunit beta n=1 Tax=Pelatocladus maniniholoensis HA4357-MV3 TaxID=1117104 RepID=A0A9E3H710_9NOST|nr:succinate--CoA ligase subunit beta [Pelatocladus maniniholoensis HA4357-MV3]BAZ69814.1 ATP-grasp domain-containing protein [Fischerella sp. NIES-4106]